MGGVLMIIKTIRKAISFNGRLRDSDTEMKAASAGI